MELIVNDKYVLATLSRLGKRSKNIYCDKFESSRRWEELQLLPMAILGVVSCAASECGYNMVEVCGNLGLVKAVT